MTPQRQVERERARHEQKEEAHKAHREAHHLVRRGEWRPRTDPPGIEVERRDGERKGEPRRGQQQRGEALESGRPERTFQPAGGRDFGGHASMVAPGQAAG